MFRQVFRDFLRDFLRDLFRQLLQKHVLQAEGKQDFDELFHAAISFLILESQKTKQAPMTQHPNRVQRLQEVEMGQWYDWYLLQRVFSLRFALNFQSIVLPQKL